MKAIKKLLFITLAASACAVVFRYTQQRTIKKQLLQFAADSSNIKFSEADKLRLGDKSAKEIAIHLLETLDHELPELNQQRDKDEAELTRLMILAPAFEATLKKVGNKSQDGRKLEKMTVKSLSQARLYISMLRGDQMYIYRNETQKNLILKFLNDPIPWRNWKFANSDTNDSIVMDKTDEWYQKLLISRPDIKSIEDRTMEIDTRYTQLNLTNELL